MSECPSTPRMFADNSTVSCVNSCPGDTFGNLDNGFCEAPLNCPDLHFADNFTKMCVTECF